MADYGGGQQGGRAARPNQYGHLSQSQRGEAFNNIFGGPPPPGRSQTPVSPVNPGPRSQTMSSQVSSQPPPNIPLQSPGQIQPRFSRLQQPTGHGAPDSYMPPNRQASGGLVQPQPQPEYLPAPSNERRSFPQPQRIDSRQLPQQVPYGHGTRPIPNRVPPSAALNSDAFRSRSMATGPSQGPFNPSLNTYNQASAASFRQQPYQGGPGASRTTAQGRVVPARQDERAMSMTTRPPERDHSQTMSGRVIPNRQREQGQENVVIPRSQPGPNPFGPSPNGLGPSSSTATASTGRTMTMNSISPSTANAPSRTMSMASTISVPPDRTDSLSHRPSVQKPNGTNSSGATALANSKAPVVYPALLSRVAEVFLDRINPGDRSKDALLTYPYAFTGREAVDLLAWIIRTTDRNLALLLGRALDAQKLFHDVTYEHRLRDSPTEIYQFRETVSETPAASVHGVVTLLTECYSPTCTRDNLCYSIACPRRLEQQARLNLKPNAGLKRQASASSLKHEEEQKLWINSVSKEIADSVGEKERKRQEVISELMYTERDFVKDLEYLRDFWLKPLRSSNPAHPSPIPERQREKFIRVVFSNFLDVLAVNSKLADALTRRQSEHPVVRNVGDIFLTYVPKFDGFIQYGSGQLFGKYEFEQERASNPTFSRFVDETERLKESRKLELNGYLTKPTTRLARYPLLLEQVLKHTDENSPDKHDIPIAVAQIKDILSRVNTETGRSENRFNLMQLKHSLEWKNPADFVDLKLTDESRQMVFKGSLKRGAGETNEVVVFLFDHSVLLAKQKSTNKKEKLWVWRKPIPLELLVIPQMDEVVPRPGIAKRPSSTVTLGNKNVPNLGKNNAPPKEVYPITFRHLGKGSYEVTLYAVTSAQRRKWLEHIDSQQARLRDRTNVYTKSILCENFFTSANKVNCCIPADGGRKLVLGTENGVFIQDRRPKTEAARPRQVLDVSGVTQIDMLEEYQILLVLQNRNLWSYPLEVLESGDNPALKRGKKILNHVNFFKSGVCLGRHLVCCAKNSSISTTVKVYEPMDTLSRSRGPRGGMRFFSSGQDSLKAFKASVEFSLGQNTVFLALTWDSPTVPTDDTILTPNTASRPRTTLRSISASSTKCPERAPPVNCDDIEFAPLFRPKPVFSHMLHTRASSSKLRGEAGEVTRPGTILTTEDVPVAAVQSSSKPFSDASPSPKTELLTDVPASAASATPPSATYFIDTPTNAPLLSHRVSFLSPTATPQDVASNCPLEPPSLIAPYILQELYVPSEATSIHFLKSKLCVATARGFEVVSLETLERQSLLDEADTSLDFVSQEKETRPVHIERLNVEFLLNYSEFSFFVDRNGWRTRHDWKITWEGQPNAFALSYPYILAFEPSFVDVRHVETSACVHIITGTNIRLLHCSTQEIIYAYENEQGQDVIASLDFWAKGRKNGEHEERAKHE